MSGAYSKYKGALAQMYFSVAKAETTGFLSHDLKVRGYNIYKPPTIYSNYLLFAIYYLLFN